MIAKNIKPTLSIVFTIIAIVAIIVSGCSSGKGTITANEESGNEFTLDESYDSVRNGARLVLNYDEQSNSFKGFVENTTDSTLKQVRVEVHLSNGVELGHTTPTDLNPGESIDISLKATDKSFDGWSAHPEVGESENGEYKQGEEDEGEHSEGDSD